MRYKDFERLRETPAPDLWPRIAEDLQLAQGAPSRGGLRGRRSVVVVVALAASGLALGFLAFAFLGGRAVPRPGRTAAGAAPTAAGSPSATAASAPGPHVVARVALPGFAGQFLAAGSLWVVEPDALARLDPATGQVAGTYALPSWAAGPVAGTDSAIWALVGNQVLEVDPGTLQPVGTAHVGGAPSHLAVGAGAVWVADSSNGTVTRIDPSTLRVAATVSLPCGDPDGCVLSDLAAGEGAARVAQLAGSSRTTVYRIDPRTDRVVAAVPVPTAGGEDLAVGGGSVWAVGMGFQRIDPVGGKVVADIQVPGIEPVGGSFHGEATFAAGYLWVLDEEGGLLYEIDPSTDQPVGTLFPFGGEQPASGLVAGPTSVWVATAFGNPQASPPPPGVGAEVAEVAP